MNHTAAQGFLIKTLSAISPLSVELQKALRREFIFKTADKGQRIKQAGEINRHLHFIVEGLVKGAYERESREDILWFARDGKFALLPDSFFPQAPTDEYIETVEESQLFQLSFQKLEELHHTFPEIERLDRILLQQQLIDAGRRERMRRHPSPQVRLRHFLKNEPTLAFRLHRFEIADYLHISRSTVYRSALWNSMNSAHDSKNA